MPSLIHPYADLVDGRWLPGTLHAHGDRTGGQRANQDVLDDYARRGYGFVMIAEHNVYTLDADYAKLSTHGMVMLPGCELTDGPHLLHVMPKRELIGLQANTQTALDAAAGDGALMVAAHPSWDEHFDHIPVSQMLQWRGLTGLEVYNGLIQKLPGSAYAVDKWDRLLSAGQHVWAFADDDSFIAKDVQIGWNVAWVKNHTAGDVVDALRRGRFYASSGVEVSTITVEGMTVRVETRNASRINVVGPHGVRLHSVNDRVLEYTVPSDKAFVRIEANAGADVWAWLQPFWVA